MSSSRTPLHLASALLALTLVGCGGSDAGGPAAPPASGSSGPPAAIPIIDQIAVPTEDEAYEAARERIDADNVDEELRRLLEEIEGSD